jgi:hypothetical protein
VGIGFVVPARQATKAGGIDSLDSNSGLLKSFEKPSQIIGKHFASSVNVRSEHSSRKKRRFV